MICLSGGSLWVIESNAAIKNETYGEINIHGLITKGSYL